MCSLRRRVSNLKVTFIYSSHQSTLTFLLSPINSSESHSRLIGIEYVISERLFQGLDPEEQKLWHSHGYDIKSGSFIAPGPLPDAAKRSLYKDLAHTYGRSPPWCQYITFNELTTKPETQQERHGCCGKSIEEIPYQSVYHSSWWSLIKTENGTPNYSTIEKLGEFFSFSVW